MVNENKSQHKTLGRKSFMAENPVNRVETEEPSMNKRSCQKTRQKEEHCTFSQMEKQQV